MLHCSPVSRMRPWALSAVPSPGQAVISCSMACHGRCLSFSSNGLPLFLVLLTFQVSVCSLCAWPSSLMRVINVEERLGNCVDSVLASPVLVPVPALLLSWPLCAEPCHMVPLLWPCTTASGLQGGFGVSIHVCQRCFPVKV